MIKGVQENNFMNRVKRYINYLIFLVCLIIPKKKNRWVFGAWFGDKISDNAYALYKYVKQNRADIECIWVCNDINAASGRGVSAVKRNSLIAIWKCLTAKVAVMNQGYIDFGDYNWIRCAYKVQLWHGVPWKKIGEDTRKSKKGLLYKLSHFTYSFISKCDLYIAPSEETRNVIKSAFITDDSHILLVGQPRNEVLFDEEYCGRARMLLQSKFGDRIIIIYMPTFRDSMEYSFSFMDIEEKIMPILQKNNAIILEKQHYVQCKRINKSKSNDRIINVEEYESQDLLAAADLLITDYSSCFFDFILRDKPIIHYIYDFDYYKSKDRGLYYDLEFVRAGLIAMNESELLSGINTILDGEDNCKGIRETIRKKFVPYERLDNSKRIVSEIINRVYK